MNKCISLIFLIAFLACQKGGKETSHPEQQSQFVGRENCISCHQKEYSQFKHSDHDLAMMPATDSTVLGDFDSASFTHFGITSKFFSRNGKFLVFTEGPGGEFREFEIKYTFGARPLQQYLVEFPGGRLQCLPFCWDTRPVEEGGQRWFHIYANQRIASDDILYWTRVSQTWNAMCAECHSTNLKKNYDPIKKTYNTTWSEIDVSCEACHGPGSQHVEWAKGKEKSQHGYSKGFDFNLIEMKSGNWVIDPETGNATRTEPLQSNTQVELCGRCHSHRLTISENHIYGQLLSQTHRVSLLEENLYFPDGQIKEEVYVYGSFLQSKMYRAGVVCTDCHDAHRGQVYVDGDGLCFRCHLSEKYDSQKHHFHEMETNIRCVDCHMPVRTYMVVDDRRDHSFRIPRPDLSEKLQTPNACNQCHTNKPTKWASDNFKKWYPQRTGTKHYGEIFEAARKSDPRAPGELQDLITNRNNPAIVRATAISLLNRYPIQKSLPVITDALADYNPMVRSAAAEALRFIPPKDRIPLLKPLLNDPVRAVRISAAGLIAESLAKELSSHEATLFEQALNEYWEAQNYNTDFPSTHLNNANFYMERGEYTEAELELMKAIEIEPLFIPSYINLADLYRMQNQDNKCELILLKALKLAPEDASLSHSLGLLYVRLGETDKALSHLAVAAANEPAAARYSYVYGVALNSAGKTDRAIKVLEKALTENPHDRDLLQALVSIYRSAGQMDKAEFYANRLNEIESQRR